MNTYLFAYGTLRPGCSLYRLIEPAVNWIHPVTTQGSLYHLRTGTDEHPIYPVADLISGSGAIFGDLLSVDGDSLEFEYMDQMEVGAGFEPITIRVVSSLDFSSIDAIGYHYPYLRGPKIESGDWKKVLTHG